METMAHGNRFSRKTDEETCVTCWIIADPVIHIPSRMVKQTWSHAVLILSLLLGGCATVSGPSARWMPVDEQGRLAGTGFEAVDMMIACHSIDEIMNALVRTPGVLGLRIRLEPVDNDTRFDLPVAAFDQAIYGQLRSSAPPMCHIQNASESIEPNLYLMGRLQRVMPTSPRDHEILLYSYQMVDAATNEVIWEDSCEVKTHLSGAAAGTLAKAVFSPGT